jgi:hypothetical protein
VLLPHGRRFRGRQAPSGGKPSVFKRLRHKWRAYPYLNPSNGVCFVRRMRHGTGRKTRDRHGEQAKPRRPIPPKFLATAFKPGVSGNPHGRALPKIRAAAEEAEVDIAIEELVLEFTDTHGRTPKRSECAVLAGLAHAERRLSFPGLSTVEMNSTINNIRLARFDLGLRTTKPRKKGIRTFAEMEREKPVINVTVQEVDRRARSGHELLRKPP